VRITTRHTDTLRWQNARFWNVEAGARCGSCCHHAVWHHIIGISLYFNRNRFCTY